MVIPWCVTLSGCRGWLLRCSNYFLYGDIGLFWVGWVVLWSGGKCYQQCDTNLHKRAAVPCGWITMCTHTTSPISKSRSSLQIFFQRLPINFLAYLHNFGTKICRILVFIHMAHTWINLTLAKHFLQEIITPANCWQPCFFFLNVMMTHQSFCRHFWDPSSFCVDDFFFWSLISFSAGWRVFL